MKARLDASARMSFAKPLSSVGRSDASRFRQRQHDGDNGEGRDGGEHVENRAPAEPGVQQPAGQRAEHLRDHHNGDDQTDHAADAIAIVDIADNGAADHHAGCATNGLDETTRNQLRQSLRKDAADVGDDDEAQAADQHRPPPKAIRQRSHHQLGQSHADHVERHGHLRD